MNDYLKEWFKLNRERNVVATASMPEHLRANFLSILDKKLAELASKSTANPPDKTPAKS